MKARELYVFCPRTKGYRKRALCADCYAHRPAIDSNTHVGCEWAAPNSTSH